METGEYAELLANVRLFAGLKRVTLAKLAAHLEAVAVPAGTELFREGDPGDAFYLVARGSLGAFMSSDGGGARRVNTLRPGDPFGELGPAGQRAGDRGRDRFLGAALPACAVDRCA